MLLSVSVVLYRSDPAVLAETMRSLAAAWKKLREYRPEARLGVVLIDNGSSGEAAVAASDPSTGGLQDDGSSLTVVGGHGNIGYGRGHNLALPGADSTYHLILNPDVRIEPQALVEALAFLDTHGDAALLAPYTSNALGTQEFLCRRYPSILDLALRGFAPAFMRGWFQGRLARYELRAETQSADVFWDPPLVSGCFMLFRTSVLKQLGGFDAAYFLYFEDYDLSLRTATVARTVFVRNVRIAHFGGGAAKKGGLHRRLFLRSAFTFFNRHGWRWF